LVDPIRGVMKEKEIGRGKRRRDTGSLRKGENRGESLIMSRLALLLRKGRSHPIKISSEYWRERIWVAMGGMCTRKVRGKIKGIHKGSSWVIGAYSGQHCREESEFPRKRGGSKGWVQSFVRGKASGVELEEKGCRGLLPAGARLNFYLRAIAKGEGRGEKEKTEWR